MKQTITLLLLFFCFISNALTVNYSNFKEEKNFNKKLILSNILWEKYIGENTDSLKILGKEVIVLSFNIKDKLGIALGKRILGSYYIRTGNQQKGIKFLLDAKKEIEKRSDYEVLTEILNELGNAYNIAGQPKKAIVWYKKSIHSGKKSPNPTSKYLAEINIGKSLTDLGKYNEAKRIIEAYITKARLDKKYVSIANAYTRLGIIYQYLNQNEIAAKYFRKSNEINLKYGSKIHASHALNNLAIIQYSENKTDSCLFYFEEALKLREECGNWKGVTESYFNIGELYYDFGKFNLAIENYYKSIEIAKKNHLLNEEIDALQAIIEIYKEQNQPEKSMHLMAEYLELKNDQLENDNVELEENITFEKEIELKEHEYLQNIRELTLYDRIQTEKTNKMVVYIVCSLLVSIFGIFLYFNSKNRNLVN